MPVGDGRQKGGFPCLGIILHRPPLDLASNACIRILYLYFSLVFCICHDSCICILPSDHLAPTPVRPRIKRLYLFFILYFSLFISIFRAYVFFIILVFVFYLGLSCAGHQALPQSRVFIFHIFHLCLYWCFVLCF